MSDTSTLTSLPPPGVALTQPRPAIRRVPPRLAFWRSPAGQPRWARPILLGIAALAAVLYAWNIRTSGYATYYSIAVKSMSVSWKAFFFGALDPGATITIDKLAGSFVPQALSARIFGYHQWSLTLPQVIEGVVSVLAMYRLVRRWFGAVAGLLAAGIFALTPILASMFGHPMEDGALTMCLVLAADAFIVAVTRARLRSLILAGVWVGLGFQAKMLQAWMVLPALGLAYLFAAPTSWRRRLAHLGLAGAVTLAVSLSWILLYTVTPAQDRPYVDGSTNNSAVAMVFGYNGLSRFGVNIPGAIQSMFGGGGRSGAPSGGNLPTGVGASSTGSVPSATGSTAPSASNAPSGAGAGASAGGGTGAMPAAGFAGGGRGGLGQDWTKMFGSSYASQIGWLYPLAVLALVVGLIWYRHEPRANWRRTPHATAPPEPAGQLELAEQSGSATQPAAKQPGSAEWAEPTLRWGGFLLWGLWLVTYFVVFSHMQIPHTAYLASLAPPLAALAAAGIVMCWRAYRDRRMAWLLPLAIVLEAAWTGYLAHQYATFLPWLDWTVLGVAALCTLVLAAGALRLRLPRHAMSVTMVLGIVTMLAVPGAWALSVLDPTYGGSAFNASAGPGGGMGGMGAGGTNSRRFADLGNGATGGQQAVPGGAGNAGAGNGGSGFRGFGGTGSAGAGGQGFAGPGGSSSDTLTAAQQSIDTYLMAHRNGAKYVAATASYQTAGPYIIATGQSFLPMGGFSGSVPQPTLAAVKQMVAKGEVRYFLLGGARGFGGGGTTGSANSTGNNTGGSTGSNTGGFPGGGPGGGTDGTVTSITTWVTSTCTEVPASEYGGDTSNSGDTSGFGGGETQQLYRCGS